MLIKFLTVVSWLCATPLLAWVITCAVVRAFSNNVTAQKDAAVSGVLAFILAVVPTAWLITRYYL
jgi:hypothetical protein